MSNRPFFAARLETTFDRRVEKLFRRVGWRDSIIGYTGYGTTDRLRVLARVLLSPAGRPTPRPQRDEAWRERRGWRNSWAVSCVHRAARLTVGAVTVHVTTDRGGYIDVCVTDHKLSPGWHQITIETEDQRPAQARVLVLPDDVRYGLISDIDDTIIASYLPRTIVAAYHFLVLTEAARQPVPGMARLYREVLRQHPGMPVFYVSTGSWNTLPFLDRFTLRHGFPAGPMLLSDWGPTNTGWFRSGPEHKLRALRSLARDFPGIQWLLVGDDGQHDPAIYARFAAEFPGRVRAIAIRQLNPVQQVLAHGTWRGLTEPNDPGQPATGLPDVRGPDGNALWTRLRPLIAPVTPATAAARRGGTA
jgi:phosphatidate phosphatase APP1